MFFSHLGLLLFLPHTGDLVFDLSEEKMHRSIDMGISILNGGLGKLPEELRSILAFSC